MRIKLDENLPISLVETLVQLGHDADSVQEVGLQVVRFDTITRQEAPGAEEVWPQNGQIPPRAKSSPGSPRAHRKDSPDLVPRGG